MWPDCVPVHVDKHRFGYNLVQIEHAVDLGAGTTMDRSSGPERIMTMCTAYEAS